MWNLCELIDEIIEIVSEKLVKLLITEESLSRVLHSHQESVGDFPLVAQWIRIHLSVQGHGFDPWFRKILHTAKQL